MMLAPTASEIVQEMKDQGLNWCYHCGQKTFVRLSAISQQSAAYPALLAAKRSHIAMAEISGGGAFLCAFWRQMLLWGRGISDSSNVPCTCDKMEMVWHISESFWEFCVGSAQQEFSMWTPNEKRSCLFLSAMVNHHEIKPTYLGICLFFYQNT